MRVLVISHAYVSKYHQQKIEALAQYPDLDVFLMVPKSGVEGGGRKIQLEKTQDPRYRIIPVESYFGGKWNSYMIKGLRKYIRKIRPDIIYIEEEYWTNVAWQLCRAKKESPKAKVVFFTWENIYHQWSREARTLYQKFRFRMFSFVERRVFNTAHAMIAGNEEAAQVLKKKGFHKPIEILPQFGVNMEYFKKKEADGLRAELRIEDAFTVGYIGRITQEKGIQDFLYAAEKLCITMGARMDIKFLIIGDGHYKEEAQRLAKKLELEHAVMFLPAVDFRRIVEYYNAMDVMIIPSRTTSEWKEQFGRTIIEAMSCGVPVIGSNSGAIPEVIGEAGLIFQEGDVEDLASKIVKIIEEGHLREELIARGLQRVKEKYTTTIIAEKTYKFYKSVLKL